MVHNGTGHILLLDFFFYGLTLIHLIDPLSQVVQIKCIVCNIYIYIYIYRERERERERDVCVHLESILFSSLGEHCTHTHLHFGLNFWEAREELIDP